MTRTRWLSVVLFSVLSLWGVPAFSHTPAMAQAGDNAPMASSTDEFRYAFDGFILTGDVLFSESAFAELFARYTQKPITFADIETMAMVIEGYYHASGYPLATVFIPEQEVSDGVLTIFVLAGRLGGFQLVNSSKLKDAKIRGVMASLPIGEPVHGGQYEGVISSLEALAGVNVDSGFVASSTPGHTEMVVMVEDGKRWGGGVTMSGSTPNLGDPLSKNATLRAFNLFGLGGQGSVTVSNGTPGSLTGRVAYEIPFGDLLQNRFSLIASLGDTRSEGVPGFSVKGGSSSVSVAVSGSKTYAGRWTFNGSAALEQNRSHYTIGDLEMERNVYSAARFGLAWQPPAENAARIFFRDLTLSLDLGYLQLLGHDQAAIDALSEQTQGMYAKVIADATVGARVGARGTVTGRAALQWASKNLGAGEQFSIAGANGVRAATSGRTRGAEGWVAQIEYAYDIPTAGRLPGSIVATAFLDAGGVTFYKRPWDASSRGGRQLYGTGLKMQWGFPSGVSMSIEQGWMLGASDQSVSPGEAGPLSVSISYEF